MYLYSCSPVLSDLTPLWKSSLVLLVRSSCVIQCAVRVVESRGEEREKEGGKMVRMKVNEGLSGRRAYLVVSIVFFVIIHTCNVQNHSPGARTKPIGQELLCLEQCTVVWNLFLHSVGQILMSFISGCPNFTYVQAALLTLAASLTLFWSAVSSVRCAPVDAEGSRREERGGGWGCLEFLDPCFTTIT